MSKNHDDELIEAVVYCNEHCLMDDKTGRLVQRIFRHEISDKFVRDTFLGRANRHQRIHTLSGSPFFSPTLTQGDIFRGFDLRGKPILHPLKLLQEHSFTIGGSGSGKTTLDFLIAVQVSLRANIWLMDLAKREWRHLRPLLSRLGIELAIVPARKLRLNPAQLPSKHVLVADWASRLADMLQHQHKSPLPPRATKLIHLTVLKLYRRFVREPPTLFDIREAVATDTKANPQARQAILDALDPILMSIGDVFRWRVGWKVEDLAKKNIVYELQGVSDADRDIILSSLFVPLLSSRVAQGLSNVPLNLVLFCDEAQRLVTSKSNMICELLGLVRGSGVGVNLSCQSGSDVAPQVFSNTGNKFIGRLTSSSDLEVMGSAMGLTRVQKQWVMTHLDRPGIFVGQLSQGSGRRPFVFRVPHMDFTKIKDDTTQSDSQVLNRLPVVPA